MMEYKIARMDAPDWSKTEWISLTHQPWIEANTVSAQAALVLSGETLFVRMEACETQIRATLTDPLASVCCDSCLEFFLAPVADDPRYINMEWNPLSTLYFGFGAERNTRVRQIAAKPLELFKPQIDRYAEGWSVTYGIPESLIRIYWPGFRFGGPMAGNFYKCGDETVSPHYLAWAPLSSTQPDFHRRQDFGLLTVAP